MFKRDAETKEQQWKSKYFNSLEELETKEKQWTILDNAMRQSLSRMSLLINGVDRKLDKQLDYLRMSVRKGADGKKIDYYQINATYFSALGEDEQKLRLARAIQLFTPGIPQVWYLDLFAGSNDYIAADRGGTGGHKEINRTTLSMADVENGLETAVVRDQLSLLKLRNNHKAFEGRLEITETDPDHLHLAWRNGSACAILEASLRNHDFTITHWNGPGTDGVMRFVR